MTTLWTNLEHHAADEGEAADSPDIGQLSGQNPSDEDSSTSPSARRPLIRLDAGWFFLAAGVMLIGATVLIPAHRDLILAQWQRDKAAAVERHHHERLENYASYLNALEKSDESVILSLAGTQLNKSPADRVPLLPAADPTRVSANIFPTLEPAPLRLLDKPDLESRASTLERWTTDDRLRLWMLAGGVLCLLMGILPASRR